MPAIITYALLLAFVLYAMMILWEFAATRSMRSFFFHSVALAGAALLLRVTTGFPVVQQAFGGTSPLVALTLMFLGVVFGIAARYVFYTEAQFSVREFLKPLVISPIVLLPLVGSIQNYGQIEAIQLVSLALLSFQNGFFWVTVLKHATPRT